MTDEASKSELFKTIVATGNDPKLYELIFNIVQEAQAAGSVVQIVTIWPAAEATEGSGPVIRPTDCQPSGACPK